MVSDSNLFCGPADRQSDVIARVSPAIDAEYRSTRLTLLGRYTVDAERFAEHASLTTPRARQQAAVDVLYRPAPPVDVRRRRVAFDDRDCRASSIP